MISKDKIKYHISPSNKSAHLFNIKITIDSPSKAGHTLTLPAWTPGSYMIRDFAKNIVWLKAYSEQNQIRAKKTDKQTWKLDPSSTPVTIEYEVYAWDLSVRTAHLDTSHGYFNGTSVFLQVKGFADYVCELEIFVYNNAKEQGWKIATGLEPLNVDEYGCGLYRANNYAELVDCPVEMGLFTTVAFAACGIPHEIILSGRHDADLVRLAADLKTICEHHLQFFTKPAPMTRYLFMVMVVGEGYGGLEHRNSTSLLCSREDLPQKGVNKVSDKYRQFLALCSHEYFHTWNVKRIKPEVFQVSHFSAEIHTELLWWFEGVTSYYDELALVRSGLITPESYLELLGQNITRVIRHSGRFKQSIAESSFDAWTKFYKQDENAPNAIVSYYAKGAMFALCLDLYIRSSSDDKFSLDSVVIGLWNKYLVDGKGIAERAIEKFIELETNVSVHAFFHRYLYDVNELPLEQLLEHVGLELKRRPAISQADVGGKPAPNPDDLLKIALGIKAQPNPLGVHVTHVYDGGSAQQCGISAGDILISFNKLLITNENYERKLHRFAIGNSIIIDLFRRDELMSFKCELQAAEETTCYLIASHKRHQRRDAWLGMGTQ